MNMCGIFGILVKENTHYSPNLLKAAVDDLFKASESRGKEASGIAVSCDGKINIYKAGVTASAFIRSKKYREILGKAISLRKPLAIIGHTRLATNGPQSDNNNNCPIETGGVIGVHNGIIVNDNELSIRFPSIERKGIADSELIFGLLGVFFNRGLSLINATQSVFNRIEGSASIAAFVKDCNMIVLATNTGSLYSCMNSIGSIYIFASEAYALEKPAKKLKLSSLIGKYSISQLRANSGCLIDINNFAKQNFSLG